MGAEALYRKHWQKFVNEKIKGYGQGELTSCVGERELALLEDLAARGLLDARTGNGIDNSSASAPMDPGYDPDETNLGILPPGHPADKCSAESQAKLWGDHYAPLTAKVRRDEEAPADAKAEEVTRGRAREHKGGEGEAEGKE